MSDAQLSNDAKNQLGDYVSRIESLLEEKETVTARIKSEYEDAASSGFDKKAIQQIIKERAADAEKTTEQRETVETYRRALAGLVGTPLGDWARQWIANDARIKTRTKNDPGSTMSDWLKNKKAASGDKPSDAA